MGKLRQTALILGEGPTEFFYFKSLCDVFKRLTVKPDYRPYETQESLLKDLNQCVEYRKTIEFFIKTKGLHGYFERNGGNLENAMDNANRSMEEKLKSSRDYTYSDLGILESI